MTQDLQENEKKRNIVTVEIPPFVQHELEYLSFTTGASQSKVIRDAIINWAALWRENSGKKLG
jgi:hypothetical protein